MTAAIERDYFLGTHDPELIRLGVQHRAWQPVVLDCWRRAGIGAGSRVLDVGAGPGHATVDLAEIVGAGGEVIAVARSARFVRAAADACRQRGFRHVQVHEMDLMTDAMPARDLDAAWCRWVACFVSSPRTLVAKIAAALRPGGVVIFHEYADYESWRLAPPGPVLPEFIREVVASCGAAGGEPNVAPMLAGLLTEAGFRIREAVPRVYCVGPGDPFWHWASSFVDVHTDRLLEAGRTDRAWVESVRQEFRTAPASTLMITPMVLEIIADRLT